jgi:hypothetical protein
VIKKNLNKKDAHSTDNQSYEEGTMGIPDIYYGRHVDVVN